MINRKNYRRINVLMLIKIMGWLVMIESLFMIFPLIVCLCYGESDWKPFLCALVATLTAGYLMNTLSKPDSRVMGKREGFLLTASVWIVFSLFGMIPFIFSSNPYTVVEAFTEAMSGLTTTGATIVDDVECLSHGLKLWRSLMQWIGGMGIILFTLAVIPMLNHSGGMQMFNAEVTGITHNKLRPRISQTAKSLWGIYIFLTITCMCLLAIGPMDVFECVTHGLSTIATGGFSIYNDGIEHYNSNYVKIITTIFMFFASVNFGIIYAIYHGRFKYIRHDDVFRIFCCLIVVLSAILLVSEYMHGCISDWNDALVNTFFMVVSAFSSTSYTSAGLERWGDLALILLVVMILIGGCAGSTSGGVKIDRIPVLLKYVRNEILHAVQPNTITTVKINRKNIQMSVVAKVIAFLALYVLIIVFGALVLSTMDIPVYDAVFTSITCISNSGTCIDIGQYGGSLAAMPDVAKIVLALIMLVGRLEIYTILVLFTPAFWQK